MHLDFVLPEAVTVGEGTAIFVSGSCFAPGADIRALSLLVDGDEQDLMVSGMPRVDVFETLHPSLELFETEGIELDAASPDDPQLRSYRSGFWGLARIGPRAHDGDCTLALRAKLADGTVCDHELGRVGARAALSVPELTNGAASAAAPEVAICMATYEPPIDLFRRQIDSIRAQDHTDWLCFISDDCSSPERFAALREVLGDDERFVVSRSPRRLGFYDNFERALSMAPAGSPYVAMSDQDDVWYPEKLSALLAEIGDAQLVYSDARIVARDGEVISDTYWSRRRNNHVDLGSLLMANVVTGAASLFRRDLLDHALPFPPRQFAHFHDHWLGVTALALGDIAYADRPLYDYVQHAGAVLGHARANPIRSLPDRLRALRADPRAHIWRWRECFFADACRLLQFGTVLTMRVGKTMPRRKRRAVQRFLRADSSTPALLALGARATRELAGRRRPQTLGAEAMLFCAFTWRRLVTATTRGLDRPRRFRVDTRPPATLGQMPARRGPIGSTIRDVADKIEPLELAISDHAPPRVNLLIPRIDLDHFFGGYIAKLNLARRLAERGARVRVVTVDPVGSLPFAWARSVESYDGLDGLFDKVEIVFGREAQRLEVSREDSFIATTWWTAHIAHDAVRSLGSERFLYLIQEYEPFTFPMGTFAALADESYRLPHRALFSTELLRGYFRRQGLGVYAGGADAGDAASAAFENAITDVRAPTAAELSGRGRRRLLFYARPEAHAARNMFELGILAINRAFETGGLHADWEISGIGAVDPGAKLDLGSELPIELIGRLDQEAYAETLREHDIGLALMYTPHPSLVPIEMAAAGMLTVTNTFENKTADALAAISSNLITVEPSLDRLATAISEAVAGVGDVPRRLAGADVHWSRDWNRSFDDALLDRVDGLLMSA